MTDVESLRQRDKEFSIEEKLLCCVWVHERNSHGKSYDDIQRDFEVRFHKKPPKHDLLIMWERNAFNSGSINFNDNYHLISNGIAPNTGGIDSNASPPSQFEAKALPDSHNSYSNSNSSHSSPGNQNRPSGSFGYSQAPQRRAKPLLHPMSPGNSAASASKNFNPALYKTEFCRQYSESGQCDYGEKCLFAHSRHELRSVPNFRTKVCTSWTYGYCQYGDNCMFIHPDRQGDRRNGPGGIAMRNSPYCRASASRMTRNGY